MHETQKWKALRTTQKKKPERKRRRTNNVDGDMPLCLRKTERKSKGGSSSDESQKDNKSRMMSRSKELWRYGKKEKQ